MSFCRYCGQELDDDARFCTGCGREIVGAGGQAEMPAGVSPAASAEPAVSSAAEPDAPQNFRAVVSKQRSRAVRRLPIPILIALALALTAGVAFASYMVYTQVVEPALHSEGVVAPNDAGVTASDAQQDSGATSADESTSSDDEPITYKKKSQQIKVNVPYDANSAKESTWSYNLIESSRQSDAVDKINEAIVSAIEDTAAVNEDSVKALNGDYGQKLSFCASRSITITYLSDEIVCVTSYATEYTGFTAHGSSIRGGAAFSLKTGEQIPLCKLIGVDQAGLFDLTYQAERIYSENQHALGASSNDVYSADKANKSTRAILEENQGALTGSHTKADALGSYALERYSYNDTGMYYLSSDYELGIYAIGHPSICVASTNPDEVSVGSTANQLNGQ